MKIHSKSIYKSILTSLILLLLLSLAACSEKAKIPDEYNYGDLSQYIKLGEYKDLEYTKITGDVTDEEIKSYIDDLLASSSETEQIKEGSVKEDSVANIDYAGSIDGVAFDGGTAEGVDLDMANNSFIPGFSDAIVGHDVGETFDINVTFPEDYHSEDLAGKDAVFKITVNYLVENKAAEYTNDWVKDNSEFTNKEDFEKSIREQLSQDKLSSADQNEKRELFNKILETSEIIEYPEKELESRTSQINNLYTEYAKSAGSSLEDFITNQMGMTAEQFKNNVEESAKETVKQELVMHQIKNLEGIEITQAAYDEYLADILKNAGYTEESFESANGKSFVSYVNDNNMFTSYLYDIVMDKVKELSNGK